MEATSSIVVPSLYFDRGMFNGSANISEVVKDSHFTGFKQRSYSFFGEYASRNGRHRFGAEYAVRDEIPVSRFFLVLIAIML
jgi:hypothetical protein